MKQEMETSSELLCLLCSYYLDPFLFPLAVVFRARYGFSVRRTMFNVNESNRNPARPHCITYHPSSALPRHPTTAPPSPLHPFVRSLLGRPSNRTSRPREFITTPKVTRPSPTNLQNPTQNTSRAKEKHQAKGFKRLYLPRTLQLSHTHMTKVRS